ncbi:MAG: DNA/RNA non-specific endonuclease [Prevotella sp.]|nr:DNA/RNA non-specific endonuclease [Prevotella sp.]
MKRTIWTVPAVALLLTLSACDAGRGKTHLPPLGGERNETVMPARDVENREGEWTEEAVRERKAVPAPAEAAGTVASEGMEIPAGKAGAASLLLHREGYTACYNTETRVPDWVAWHLTASHTDGPVQRKGISFHEDEDAPLPRVDTYDYSRSGFDRGHMCPAGDNRWSQLAMEQSFLMTNVCPQNHALNSGMWNTIEEQCRAWAERYGDVYIVCGPVFLNQRHKTIGKHKVMVPEAFFKVVLRLKDGPEAIGFICRNSTAKGHKKTDYVNSVDDVERITGIDFFPQLPDDVEQRVERDADMSRW